MSNKINLKCTLSEVEIKRFENMFPRLKAVHHMKFWTFMGNNRYLFLTYVSESNGLLKIAVLCTICVWGGLIVYWGDQLVGTGLL